jgi:hypothetical protein
MTTGVIYPSANLLVGTLVTADLLASMLPRYARKAASEAAPTSSATTQNDDELFVSVEANASYFVDGWFRYSAASSTPDLRLNYSYPAGATFTRTDWGAPTTTAATADTIDTTVQSTGDSSRGGDASPRSIYTRGDLVVGSTSGTFQVKFGQVTSSADAVTMISASRIILTRYA